MCIYVRSGKKDKCVPEGGANLLRGRRNSGAPERERETEMAKMNVDFEACKGCALCTTACPKKIVEISHEKLNAKGYYTAVCIDDDACIACAMCAMMCPDCAITIRADGGDK